MPGTLNNRLILRDKYIRDTALSEGDLKEQLVEARAQLAVAVAALEAAPKWPEGNLPWHMLAGRYRAWYNSQRQAAIARCEPEAEP